MELPETLKVNVDEHMKSIAKGSSPEELMKEFDIPDRSVLLSGLMVLKEQSGRYVFVPGLIGRASVEGRHTEEGKRVDPAMLEDTDMPSKPSDLDRVRAEAEATADDRYAVTLDRGILVFTRNR